METYPPLSELLPHRGPSVLLDAVLENRRDSIRVRAHIGPQHPYLEPGRGVPVWVGIELMAQAIAVHAGLTARRSQRAPRKGMLLGTRRFEASSPYFTEGTELEVEARREFGEDGDDLAACACSIMAAGQILASATLIVVEVNEEDLP